MQQTLKQDGEMMEETWTLTFDEEIWIFEYIFKTKEEVIKFGEENFDWLFDEHNGFKYDPCTDGYKYFYIGQAVDYIPKIDTEGLLCNISQYAYERVGDVAEDFLYRVKPTDVDDLDLILNDAFSGWLKRTGNDPSFSEIINFQTIKWQ